ncbi:hypothetical protein BH09PLA1_BH09PLA1_36310 [soil metagenome]
MKTARFDYSPNPAPSLSGAFLLIGILILILAAAM